MIDDILSSASALVDAALGIAGAVGDVGNISLPSYGKMLRINSRV